MFSYTFVSVESEGFTGWLEIEKFCERLEDVLLYDQSISQIDWNVKKIYWRIGMFGR